MPSLEGRRYRLRCFEEMKDPEMKRSGRGSPCNSELGVRPRVCVFHYLLLFFPWLQSTCITEHMLVLLGERTAVTPHRKPCTAVTPESCCPLWLLSPSFPTWWSYLNFPIPSGFWLLPDKTRPPGMLWVFSEITEVKPFHGEPGGWSRLQAGEVTPWALSCFFWVPGKGVAILRV